MRIHLVSQWLNRLQAGLAAVFIAASVCGLLSIGTGSDSSSPAGYVFIFMLPLGFWSGWSVAASRFRSLGDSVTLPTSPFLVELRARYYFTTMVSSHNTADKKAVDISLDGSDQKQKTTSLLMHDSTFVHSFEHHSNDPWVNIERLLAAGLAQFPSSAAMEVFAATYEGLLRGPHLERIHLMSASQKSNSLDFEFFIAQRCTELEEEARKSGGSSELAKKVRSISCSCEVEHPQNFIHVYWLQWCTCVMTCNRPLTHMSYLHIHMYTHVYTHMCTCTDLQLRMSYIRRVYSRFLYGCSDWKSISSWSCLSESLSLPAR